MNQFEKTEIGKKIRKIREDTGLSVDEFSKILKESVKDIRQWELGKNLPNSKKLNRILEFKYDKTHDRKKIKGNATDKVKVYKMTQKQLDTFAEQVKESERKIAFNNVFKTILSVSLKALESEGFGKVRIGRVLDKILEILKQVEQEEISVFDLEKELKDKYGIEVSVSEELGIERKS